jgi:hypothetical protein
MNVQNVLPKFLDTAEESKDMWRLEKAIMKPVVLTVGTVGTFATGTVCLYISHQILLLLQRQGEFPAAVSSRLTIRTNGNRPENIYTTENREYI